jgi:hypothetical protein
MTRRWLALLLIGGAMAFGGCGGPKNNVEKPENPVPPPKNPPQSA